ncbi:hypothetical protein [Streptomyces sp. R33]|uniref:FG-GAP repeat protein n=1 Tax=Streptomyces sp. R33 TaxID=3238629 RepID=A0AB39XVC9_9ACTN
MVTEDTDGDGFADMVALNPDGLWVFSRYTGAGFTKQKKMAGAVLNPRDVIFRDDTNTSHGLLLRKGKAAANGGVDLASLSAAADSEGGQDYTYATTGWGRTTIPMLLSTPDTNGDGIPDIRAVDTLGNQWLFQGGTTTLGGASGRDEDGWNKFLTIG